MTVFSKSIIRQFQEKQTPFYYYDLDLLRRTLSALRRAVQNAPFKVHYALKANVNRTILKLIHSYGFGADCVSGNEIEAAIDAGFAAKDIVFAGVGKSDREITRALAHNIDCFNCESAQEIAVLNQFAATSGKIANIALRINPDLDAGTHHYITTGREENKFGIHPESIPGILDKLSEYKQLRLTGIHFHLGSQISNFDVFRQLCERANTLQNQLADSGHLLEHINVGGGLGIDYQSPDAAEIPDFSGYFDVFRRHLEIEQHQTVHFELGRSIVGQCGSLICKTLFIKEGLRKTFIILDGGMTELIRPALYQATHTIENISNGAEATNQYDVVGPICESSDTFGKDVPLPPTQRGDLIAIRSAGAYGQVMSSQYNLRDLAPAIYSDDLEA